MHACAHMHINIHKERTCSKMKINKLIIINNKIKWCVRSKQRKSLTDALSFNPAKNKKSMSQSYVVNKNRNMSPCYINIKQKIGNTT